MAAARAALTGTTDNGTGSCSVLEVARALGALTIGVVTKPFQFEGQRRMRIADDGITVDGTTTGGACW